MARFTIHDLAKTIDARAASSGEASYTKKLLDKGTAHCAKKLGEEAVETVIAALETNREPLVAESADLIYHLLVLLKSRGVNLEEVEAALAQRTSMSGRKRRPRARKTELATARTARRETAPWISALPTRDIIPTACSRASNGQGCATTRR